MLIFKNRSSLTQKKFTISKPRKKVGEYLEKKGGPALKGFIESYARKYYKQLKNFQIKVLVGLALAATSTLLILLYL